MKKKLLIFGAALFAGVGVFTAQAQNAIPYLPQADNFGGSSIAPADLNAFNPPAGDYTLQVAGSVGQEISIAGGAYTYTPTTGGLVRFAQRNGIVYIYEGDNFVGTTTSVSQATFPTIYSDADDSVAETGIYDAENLLDNPGFETTMGENLNTEADKRYASAVWLLSGENEYTSAGIRVNVDNASYENGREGLATLLWRCDGASTNTRDLYFYQPLTGLQPNTEYKIQFHVLTHNQGRSCTWLVGAGSTPGGYEYSENTFSTPNTNFTSMNVEFTFKTPSQVEATSYFTLGNDGLQSSSTWTIIHLDRMTLVEGTSATGIAGTAAATFLDGTAYAPEFTLADGDYYDMTSYISNPDFEEVQTDKSQTIPGWTKTGTSNSEYCTRTDAGPNSGAFKSGNVYFQHWSSSRPDFSISQDVTGLPDGQYTLKVLAGGDTGTTGTFIYAGENETEVLGDPGEFTVDAIAIGGTLTIGFKSVSRTVSWAYADNFRLSYFGPVTTPTLAITGGEQKLLSEDLNTASFTVNATSLTGYVTLACDIAGVTFSVGGTTTTTISKADAEAGQTVTVTFDKDATGTATAAGTITISSAGAENKTVAVVTSKDSECFTLTHPEATNLASDPIFVDVSKMNGWGSRSLLVDVDAAYCGASCAYINGGSYDQALTSYEAATDYIAYAWINPNGNTITFGAHNLGQTDMTVTADDSETTGWRKVTLEFTTGAALTANPVSVHFNGAGSSGAYIDNLEIYKKSDLTGTSVSVDTVEDVFTVSTVVGGIVVSAAGAENVKVYSVLGQLVKQADVNAGETFIALPAGMYIVNGQKVIVK